MPNCELCGKRGDNLLSAFVEGVKMQVCESCARFGKVAEVRRDFPVQRKQAFAVNPEEGESVVESFSSIIRSKREGMGLSQKEFAEKLSEKESFIAKVENGVLTPSIATAKKIERILGVKLVEKEKNVHISGKKEAGALTIGDLLKKGEG